MDMLNIKKKTMEKSLIPCADDVITMNSFLLVNLFIKRAAREISANKSMVTHAVNLFCYSWSEVLMKLREALIHVMDSSFT